MHDRQSLGAGQHGSHLGPRAGQVVALRDARQQSWPRHGRSSPAPPGAHVGSLPAVVGERHRRQMEAAIDLLRVSLELESHCDFGDPPGGDGRGRAAFVAHFEGWEGALLAWEETVRRQRSAPAKLWSWLAASAGELGLTEPPLALGPLIDRLAILTVQRSRDGSLRVRHPLFVQELTSGHGAQKRVAVYVEGQRVAMLPEGTDPLGLSPGARLCEAIQTLFDAAQLSDVAADIGRSADQLLEMKHVLLERLNELAAADTMEFAEVCPVCRPVTSPKASGRGRAAGAFGFDSPPSLSG
jgi:hypothetical protein